MQHQPQHTLPRWAQVFASNYHTSITMLGMSVTVNTYFSPTVHIERQNVGGWSSFGTSQQKNAVRCALHHLGRIVPRQVSVIPREPVQIGCRAGVLGFFSVIWRRWRPGTCQLRRVVPAAHCANKRRRFVRWDSGGWNAKWAFKIIRGGVICAKVRRGRNTQRTAFNRRTFNNKRGRCYHWAFLHAKQSSRCSFSTATAAGG